MLGGLQERIQPVFGSVFNGGPAQEAQLESGDRVLAIDGVAIRTFSEMVEHVSARPDQALNFKINRGGEVVEARVQTRGVPSPNPLEKDKKVGRIGVGAGAQKAKITVWPQALPPWLG